MAREMSAWSTRLRPAPGRGERGLRGPASPRRYPRRAAPDGAAGEWHHGAVEASLTGRLLVAGPRLVDPNFIRTVVFVCRHDDDGRPGGGPQPSHGHRRGRGPARLGGAAGPAARRLPRRPGAARDGSGAGPAGARARRPGRVRRLDPYRRAPGPGRPERAPGRRGAAPWRACGCSPATPAGRPANSTSRSPRATGGCCRPMRRTPSPPAPEGLWRRVLRRQPGPVVPLRRLPPRPVAQLTPRPAGAGSPSVQAELVALGVLHHHPVGAHLLLGPQHRGPQALQAGRRPSDVLPPLLRRPPRPPLTLRSRCTRFFTTLPSGTFWKKTRGPAPSGSTTAA